MSPRLHPFLAALLALGGIDLKDERTTSSDQGPAEPPADPTPSVVVHGERITPALVAECGRAMREDPWPPPQIDDGVMREYRITRGQDLAVGIDLAAEESYSAAALLERRPPSAWRSKSHGRRGPGGGPSRRPHRGPRKRTRIAAQRRRKAAR